MDRNRRAGKEIPIDARVEVGLAGLGARSGGGARRIVAQGKTRFWKKKTQTPQNLCNGSTSSCTRNIISCTSC